MKRITGRDSFGHAFVEGCSRICEGIEPHCGTCREITSAIDRLAEYEELGLLPDQIRRIDVMYRELAEKLAEYEKLGIPANAIAEYKKFEDELVYNNITFGRVLELVEEERCRKMRVN